MLYYQDYDYAKINHAGVEAAVQRWRDAEAEKLDRLERERLLELEQEAEWQARLTAWYAEANRPLIPLDHLIRRVSGLKATFVLELSFYQSACDALIGDINEGFSKRKAVSRLLAFHWYCQQIATSLPPIIWAALVRRIQGVSVRGRL